MSGDKATVVESDPDAGVEVVESLVCVGAMFVGALIFSVGVTGVVVSAIVVFVVLVVSGDGVNAVESVVVFKEAGDVALSFVVDPNVGVERVVSVVGVGVMFVEVLVSGVGDVVSVVVVFVVLVVSGDGLTVVESLVVVFTETGEVALSYVVDTDVWVEVLVSMVGVGTMFVGALIFGVGVTGVVVSVVVLLVVLVVLGDGVTVVESVVDVFKEPGDVALSFVVGPDVEVETVVMVVGVGVMFVGVLASGVGVTGDIVSLAVVFGVGVTVVESVVVAFTEAGDVALPFVVDPDVGVETFVSMVGVGIFVGALEFSVCVTGDIVSFVVVSVVLVVSVDGTTVVESVVVVLTETGDVALLFVVGPDVWVETIVSVVGVGVIFVGELVSGLGVAGDVVDVVVVA